MLVEHFPDDPRLHGFPAGIPQLRKWVRSVLVVVGRRLCAIQGHDEERPMSSFVERFVDRLHDAEEDLTREVEEQQRRWQCRIRRGRVWFDNERRHAHRRLRQSTPAYIRHGNVPSLLTAPVIDSLRLPLVMRGLWQLRQRVERVRAGSGRAHRALLVSHQTRSRHPTPHPRYHVFVDYGDARG
jgi:hypothetical protein